MNDAPMLSAPGGHSALIALLEFEYMMAEKQFRMFVKNVLSKNMSSKNLAVGAELKNRMFELKRQLDWARAQREERK
jgi:hypothetical protein